MTGRAGFLVLTSCTTPFAFGLTMPNWETKCGSVFVRATRKIRSGITAGWQKCSIAIRGLNRSFGQRSEPFGLATNRLSWFPMHRSNGHLLTTVELMRFATPALQCVCLQIDELDEATLQLL